ncbi:low density lipoprotein receptor adapter protein 1-like isoform X3 [Salvelinus namaycush]|uniref:Low density lipoprotein receptor adapter protein 1-like isoform X3 n=1 Tax=Salvelinus namaycush TaxID=8040 RepID=A0A8U0PC94_SALNM|nr:low density lipoprotein receptor adapter protein 1-like isoform X3 [Salvelinus namaycush]
MPRSNEIQEQMRNKVIDIYPSGKGYKAISKALGLQRTTVRDITHKWRTFGTVVNLPRSGRPTNITPRAQRRLIQEVTKEPTTTSKELQASLASDKAQAVTLTVAQAFRVAFELWQVAKEEEEKRVKSSSAGEATSSAESERSNNLPSLKGGISIDVATGNLLDLEELTHVAAVLETNGNEEFKVDNHTAPEHNDDNNTVWEIEEDLDEAFSRLAVSRTNPQVLDIGVTPQDWLIEPDWANGNTPNKNMTNKNASNKNTTIGDDFFGF